MSTKIILIVEDDQDLRSILEKKIGNVENLEIISAADGAAGIKIAADNHPHLIILDLLMPNMNGMEFLKELRSKDWGKETPVVILSNFQEPEYISEAMRYKVFNYHVKSDVSLDEVVEIVQKKLAEVEIGNQSE